MQTVKFNGKKYQLLQDATPSANGNTWEALALELSANIDPADASQYTHKVIWSEIEYDQPIDDFSDACDWDNPSDVISLI